MLSRRDLLRRVGLGALAIAAVGILDAKLLGSGMSVAQSGAPRSDPDPDAVASGVASMQALGVALWSELSDTSPNLAISPFSVAVSLGMTANGARGETLAQMLDVLAVRSLEAMNLGYNAVTQHVEGMRVDVANALFGQEGLSWKGSFLDELARSYGTGVQQVDYRGDTEQARTAINDWTSRQTHGRIPEILPSGAVSEATRLTLVNAIYLKATWAEEFDKSATQDGDFHLADGTTVTVPLMTSGDVAVGVSGNGWRGARLDYKGHTLAMTVVLPDASGLEALDGWLAEVGLAAVSSPPGRSLTLTMPRWTIDVGSAMSDALRGLGMTKAFSDTADFSGMTADDLLQISSVLHQVFVKVDEEGTEAAAATAVVADEATSVVETDPPLVLDRPFLYVIHDTDHGTPLFVGRVGNPLENA